MFLADVIGTVVSGTVQIPALKGRTLLLVRPLKPDGSPAGTRPRVAIDRIGAGVGDRVIVIDEGNSGRQILGAPGPPLKDAPVKTIVVGYVDSIELRGEVVYDPATAAPLS
jgi:microcompartment protein CcmK/EutM